MAARPAAASRIAGSSPIIRLASSTSPGPRCPTWLTASAKAAPIVCDRSLIPPRSPSIARRTQLRVVADQACERRCLGRNGIAFQQCAETGDSDMDATALHRRRGDAAVDQPQCGQRPTLVDSVAQQANPRLQLGIGQRIQLRRREMFGDRGGEVGLGSGLQMPQQRKGAFDHRGLRRGRPEPPTLRRPAERKQRLPIDASPSDCPDEPRQRPSRAIVPRRLRSPRHRRRGGDRRPRWPCSPTRPQRSSPHPSTGPIIRVAVRSPVNWTSSVIGVSGPGRVCGQWGRAEHRKTRVDPVVELAVLLLRQGRPQRRRDPTAGSAGQPQPAAAVVRRIRRARGGELAARPARARCRRRHPCAGQANSKRHASGDAPAHRVRYRPGPARHGARATRAARSRPQHAARSCRVDGCPDSPGRPPRCGRLRRREPESAAGRRNAAPATARPRLELQQAGDRAADHPVELPTHQRRDPHHQARRPATGHQRLGLLAQRWLARRGGHVDQPGTRPRRRVGDMDQSVEPGATGHAGVRSGRGAHHIGRIGQLQQDRVVAARR